MPLIPVLIWGVPLLLTLGAVGYAANGVANAENAAPKASDIETVAITFAAVFIGGKILKVW